MGLTSRRPQGKFFSTTMAAVNASIHARCADPAANISSISAQQHPTHEIPCRIPKANELRDGLSADQHLKSESMGEWHFSRQRRLTGNS